MKLMTILCENFELRNVFELYLYIYFKSNLYLIGNRLLDADHFNEAPTEKISLRDDTASIIT